MTPEHPLSSPSAMQHKMNGNMDLLSQNNDINFPAFTPRYSFRQLGQLCIIILSIHRPKFDYLVTLLKTLDSNKSDTR